MSEQIHKHTKPFNFTQFQRTYEYWRSSNNIEHHNNMTHFFQEISVKLHMVKMKRRKHFVKYTTAEKCNIFTHKNFVDIVSFSQVHDIIYMNLDKLPP